MADFLFPHLPRVLELQMLLKEFIQLLLVLLVQLLQTQLGKQSTGRFKHANAKVPYLKLPYWSRSSR